MRNKVISIKGINRNVVSPENDVGFCSELINLKDENGIKVVSNKEVVSANIPYINIRMHRINTKINYIGIKDDATGVDVVHFNPSSGEIIQTIKHFPVGHEVYFVTLTNQLVISNRTTINEYVYTFENEYKVLFEGVDFDFLPKILRTQVSTTETFQSDISAKNKEEYVAGCNAYLNKYEKENKFACEGKYLYAFSLTYYDGTESGMYGLECVPGNYFETTIGKNLITATGSQTGGNNDYITTKFNIKGYYYNSTLTVTKNDTFFSRYKDLIRSVNLYVSKPVSMFPLTIDNVKVAGMGWDGDTTGVVSVTALSNEISELGLEKQLLYRQKSWSLEQFCQGVNYSLEFGGDEQTTGATMEVYGSNIDRAGKMYTYNKRVHFFDSAVRLNAYLPNTEYSPFFYASDEFSEYTTAKANIIVHLKGADKNLVLRYDDRNVFLGRSVSSNKLGYILPEFFVFPDSRAYMMEVVITSSTSLSSEAVGQKYTVTLSPSPAYNYAYAFGGVAYNVDNGVVFDGIYPEQDNTYIETDVINVSSSGLPFNFPVDYSYRFDGNIRAISVAISPISDTQVGQYPLDVFTDNGIYALQQGSGAVLYSSIVPISDDVCENREVVPTRYGILYIAHNSLYLLEGRKATKLSLLLEGEVDTYIQNNDSFIKCCGGSLYDITAHLSVVEFREYIKGATLVWCTNTNEVIVSNKDYNYSYVYDFIFNSWHKVSGIYERVEDNIVSKPITINTDGATPAKGIITLSAIHSEQSKTFSSLCSATYDTTYSCGPGHTIALLVNGTQVASATFSQTTRMPMIVATLCEKISYLEDTIGMIYSKADLSGQTVEIYNTSMQTTMSSSSFVASSQSVTIPDKAIGATITVTIAGIIFSAPFTSSSSVVTLMSEIADKINASTSCPVNAMLTRNIITLTAKNTGLITNNIKISAVSSDDNYIYISTDNPTLTGGKDISLEPSDYRELIDWSKETQGGQTKVHLHTRPLCLDNPNGYKTLKRTMLNCLCELTGEQNLSLYIYGSNNLVDWKCICAAQRQNCTIAQITADRAAKAYKYFIFMIGGIVNDNTQLSSLFTTLEDIAPNKLR